MKKTRIIVELIAILFFIILILSFVRLKPEYIIYGSIGCVTELFQVSEHEIRVDTSYEVSDKARRELLCNLKGCSVSNLDKKNMSNFKVKIPIIMLFDFRNNFGGPSSNAWYYYFEFKLFGIVRHYIISEPSKSIYFPDVVDRINEKEFIISKEFSKDCLRKSKTFIDCD